MKMMGAATMGAGRSSSLSLSPLVPSVTPSQPELNWSSPLVMVGSLSSSSGSLPLTLSVSLGGRLSPPLTLSRLTTSSQSESESVDDAESGEGGGESFIVAVEDDRGCE